MSDCIRVLHVVTQMDRAGLETMLMNYYRHLDRSKIQFDFLTHRSEKGDYDEEILSLGGKIYHVPPIHPRTFVSYLEHLNVFFRTHPEYNIVHSHIDSLSVFPLRAAARAGVPIRIAHSHNNNFDKDYKYPIRILAKNLIPFYATDYFACSDAAAKFLFGERIVKKHKVHILNNAINTEKFGFDIDVRHKVRQELKLADQLVIGHIGRFSYQKNHEFLIDIFAEIVCQEPTAVLLLIGRGEDEEKIRRKVQQLGLNDSVRFLGVREDIPQLMQAMDVFLLPSHFEGLPVVGIEAQAAGLPCVMSSVITPEVDITHNITFCPLISAVPVWSKAVREYSSFVRPDTKQTVRQAGYDIITEVKKIADDYLNLFARLNGKED